MFAFWHLKELKLGYKTQRYINISYLQYLIMFVLERSGEKVFKSFED